MLRSLSMPAAARWRTFALVIAAMSLFLGACDKLDDNQIGFWDIMASMVVFFFWFMFIWIWITCLADLFRRNDLSGGMKAVWIVVIIFLPLLGCLIYMVARPKATAQDVQMMAQAKAASQAAAGVSKADQLAQLDQLKAAGTINAEQYESLKSEIIG